MIYVSENKVTLCKGDFRPAQFYKGDKKIAGYEKEAFLEEKVVALENCYNDKLYNAKIYGNTIQSREPSPESPVVIRSVGDLVADGEHAGKYKISIMVHSEEDSDEVEIYLDEPLRKIGDYEDYIDFENKKVVRNTSERIFKGTESWARENFRLYCECGKRSDLKSAEVNCIANRYRAYPWNTLYRNSYLETKTIGVALQAGSYLVVTPAQIVPTVSEWKEQLSAWNNEGNPLTVVYVGTRREEDIFLPELPTQKDGVTYEININVPARISGEYKRTEV